MIQLFKNIENYNNLCLRDMSVVARNYGYFVPENRATEYCQKAFPLIKEAHQKVRKYFSAFETERKELSAVIEEFFDKEYFETQKKRLKNNMFDTNYLLKDFLEKMDIEQLETFGLSLIAGAMISDLFMTQENYYNYTYDLAVLTGKAFDYPTHLKEIAKEDLINTYLEYIDLNIILADNVAESILNGSDLQHVIDYIKQTENLKYNLLYKATILV